MNNEATDKSVFVRPDVAAFLALLEQVQSKPMNEMPHAEAREAYRAMRFLADAEPTELTTVHDLTCPGPAGDINLRYYDAKEKREEGAAIVFFHGGGFTIGDLETHHPFCTEMAAQLDLPLIAVDYRLAPEAPFPAAPDDCEAATRWIAENAKEALGLDINGMILCGDSAGGNLAIVTAQSLANDPATVPIIAQIPLYPVVDSSSREGSFTEFDDGYFLTSESMKWFDDAYAAKPGDIRHDCITGNLVESPPTILVTAGLDPLRDQGRDYAARLVKAGIDVSFMEMPGTIHGFICLRKGIPSAQQDCDKMFSRIKSVLAHL